jgi:hypothetical protein
VVDAFTAQHADGRTKPITLTFALAGLYLVVEKGWTGRQVQRTHMLMARRRRRWPALALPPARGSITAVDVMSVSAAAGRDEAIHAWCRAVWDAHRGSRKTVVDLLREYGIE